MLPTFVIGLREGLEAALIVGIIAAFLRKQGRLDLLRWVFAGVTIAVMLCAGVGVALDVLSKDLPQKQQEGLETVIGVLAVGMVTYMVVWMKRNSRQLKGALEGAAAYAMEDGASKAGRAMVLMAFLAVLREGFETVVFLLAAFNESGSGTSAGIGAALGVAVAIVLGYGIYRGGVRLNLSKFFRATGLVLVAVAAGLVLTAFHTAHEAGWLNAGQGSTVDLSWLVRPNSVLASLLTGMLGIQPHPVAIELIGWLAYLVPVGAFVAWPQGRAIAPRRVAVAASVAGALAGIAALVLAVAVPSAPSDRPIAHGNGRFAMRVVGGQGQVVKVAVTSTAGTTAVVVMRYAASAVQDGVAVDRYTARSAGGDATLPSTDSLTTSAIAKLNGGRLPLGLTSSDGNEIPVTYDQTTRVVALVEPHTQRVVSGETTSAVTATLHPSVGAIPLDETLNTTTSALTPDLAAAKAALSRIDSRSDRQTVAVALGAAAVMLLLVSVGFGISARNRPTVMDTPGTALIGHQVRLT